MAKTIVSRGFEVELLDNEEWLISNGKTSDECKWVTEFMECSHSMRVRAKADVGYSTCSWETCPIKRQGD